MAYTFTPSGASSTTVIYGVAETLENYIIQDLSVNEDVATVQIPDQKGAIAQIKSMQHHWTITFTAIGPDTAPATVGASKEVAGITGMVMSCERRSTYNDTAKWSITMDCYDGASYGPLHP